MRAHPVEIMYSNIIKNETINNIYPDPSWFRVLMDSSKTIDCVIASVGIFCKVFSFYSLVGVHVSVFHCEISAFHFSLS